MRAVSEHGGLNVRAIATFAGAITNEIGAQEERYRLQEAIFEDASRSNAMRVEANAQKWAKDSSQALNHPTGFREQR